MTAATARRDDAGRARRAELLGRRRLLAAGHRADVASALGLARLACVEELSADLGRLRDRVLTQVDHARPGELADLARSWEAELTRAGERLDRTFADRTGPDLRRLAARLCPGAPVLPVPEPERSGADALRAAPGPFRPGRTLFADPRLVGVLAGLPALAVHGIGVPAALVAAGLVLLAGCLARARVVATERDRLREHVSRAVAAAAVAGERELARRLIRTEAAVVAALDRAVRDRRDRVDAELAAISPAGAGTGI